MTHEEREQALSEEDYIELRHRFGTVVENVVRDMVSGKGERWEQARTESEDAVSREAVLDYIHRILTQGTGKKKSFEFIQKYVEKLPPVKSQEPKWIPVSERLPNHDEYIKNNGLFNVSDGNRSYSEWFDIYDKQSFGEPTITGFRVDYAVTAWMPLPQPYKPESEDKE